MYLLAHTTTRIDCSRDAAFNYAANLENFAQWFPGVIRMTAADSLPFDAVGKRYREIVAVPWRGQRAVLLSVVEVANPSRIVTEGALASILPRMEIDFREEGPGHCEVDWRMFSRTTSGFVRWMILPFARCLMTRRAQAGLRRLKSRLEAGRGLHP
jgi:hypothetical protein